MRAALIFVLSRAKERVDSRERRRCAAHHFRAAAAAVILTPRQEIAAAQISCRVINGEERVRPRMRLFNSGPARG